MKTNHEAYQALKDKIIALNHHYYTLDNPVATDNEWDALYQELLAIESEHPEWIELDSPSQRVGGDVLAVFEKAVHTIQPLSLNKAQTEGELAKFFSDVQKELSRPFELSAELKYDGLTLVLRYENGYLTEARTRGRDGVGENVTEQAKTIRSIPLKISFLSTLEVQAEAYMPRKRLKELNAELQLAYDDEVRKLKEAKGELTAEKMDRIAERYKSYNERNVAAGSIRQLDPKVTAARKLDAYVYSVVLSDGITFATQQEMQSFLSSQGFKVHPLFYIISTVPDAMQVVRLIESERDSLDFAIDGVVFKVNDVAAREELGTTSKHPKWGIAYKFDALEERTRVREILVDVGRTGKISFVGVVDEVDFGGVRVTRVTLNNIGDIRRKGILLDGEVFLRRSNDVIPEVTGGVPGTVGRPFEAPDTCPSCGTALIEVKALLYCPNHEACPAQSLQKFVHFSSREAMNIEGLSEKTIAQLVDAGLLKNLTDLYRINRESLLLLERFGEKKADKLLAAIEASKSRPAKAFLYAIGIRNVGRNTSNVLLEHFRSIEKVAEATVGELQSLDDIGQIVSEHILAYFANETNRMELEVFKSFGLSTELEEKTEQTGTRFAGKVFVITGKLSRPRPEVAAYIEENGGSVGSGISKKTDYLVLGEDAGSKKAKAEKLGIAILSESELERLS